MEGVWDLMMSWICSTRPRLHPSVNIPPTSRQHTHTYTLSHLRKWSHHPPQSLRSHPWLFPFPYIPSSLPCSMFCRVCQFYQSNVSQTHLLFSSMLPSLQWTHYPWNTTRVTHWISPWVLCFLHSLSTQQQKCFLKTDQIIPLIMPLLKTLHGFPQHWHEIRSTDSQ